MKTAYRIYLVGFSVRKRLYILDFYLHIEVIFHPLNPMLR